MDAIDRTFRHLVQTIQNHFPAYLDQPFEVAELYQTILPYRHHRRELGFETNQDYELVLLQLLSGARDYLIVDGAMRESLARELASPTPSPGAFREFNTSQLSLNPEAVERLAHTETEGTAATAARSVPTPPAAPAAPAPEPRPSSSATTQRISVSRTRAAAGSGGAVMSGTAPGGSPMSEGGSGSSSRAASPSQQEPPAENRPQPRAAQAPAAAPRTSATVGATAAGGARASLSSRSATPSTGRTTGIVVQPGEQCRYCAGSLPSGRRITFCPHCGQNLTVVNCMACGTELELGWKFCTTCGRPVTA
ncbi:MAG TPA: zinc ribbon domain-containing protein [Gemmatimonadaceae bacterium]|nr:zinc ribbon domain-containing protein [Gemmatimonadaceae bacterium]